MGLNKVETRLDTKSHGVVEAFDIVSVGCFEMYLSWNERKGENEEAERKLGGERGGKDENLGITTESRDWTEG